MELNWRQTWPDKPNDGIGTHPDRPNLKARVYLEPGGKRWFWTVADITQIGSGLEPTKEAAKRAAEEASG